jgi:DNA gyrase/topoisomerase IV subunit B
MSDFKVLSDRDHVLQRTGMYAGSVVEEPISGIIDYKWQSKKIVPALLKCVEELYQNSIDEHIRTNGEYAKNISVNIENTIDGTVIIVEDDGRGIPVDKIGDSYRPVLAWTELRAGSNFDDSEGRVTAGMNGMGSSICNVLSRSFIGTACDGTHKCVVTCTDNMSNIEYKISKTTHRGTKVEFIPDLARFGLETFTKDHEDVLRDRLMNLAILYQQITFSFNKEKFKFKNIKQVAKNFDENAVSYQQDDISLVFAPAGSDEEFRCLSYVNGIYVKNGGSHVDYVLDKIVVTLREHVTKKHKINVLPNQIKQHLLFASWIQGFKNLKFDSQTKERITNSQSEVSEILGKVDYDKIAKQILNTESIIDPMISAILYKKELEEKRALAKANKDLDKSNLRKISKFTDASNKTDRKNCLLTLCEGDSAANSVLSARTEMIGCYPLKGKVINAMGASIKDLMNNKEVVDLMTVLGLKIGERVESINDLRFGKIVSLTDQDADGQHIFGLLCALFKKHWPELFELGAVYKFITPLVKVQVGKNEMFFYSQSEFKNWIASNKNVKFTSRYLKGLGSSTAKDFKQYFENMDKHLIKVTIDDVADLDVVDLVFGKEQGASDKRKVWLDLEEQA